MDLGKYLRSHYVKLSGLHFLLFHGQEMEEYITGKYSYNTLRRKKIKNAAPSTIGDLIIMDTLVLLNSTK